LQLSVLLEFLIPASRRFLDHSESGTYDRASQQSHEPLEHSHQFSCHSIAFPKG